jgi:hypothetical protein
MPTDEQTAGAEMSPEEENEFVQEIPPVTELNEMDNGAESVSGCDQANTRGPSPLFVLSLLGLVFIRRQRGLKTH